MSGKVVHFEIPADDAERASAFYRSAFDWSITAEPGMEYWALRTTQTGDDGMPSEPGAINGGLFIREPSLRTPIVTVDVDNIDDTLARIEELGGSTVQPKSAVADMGFAAYFADSEGNIIGLWENAAPAAPDA
jgi:predicted enzyme related to lactoylglutathione lyase